ncbi:hypothetical protein B0H13DRAFT_1088231 [Mycena leptocephala]|nr:hypothetical protein B0H13DRAFT_1088231 [Mycena leptocephala]
MMLQLQINMIVGQLLVWVAAYFHGPVGIAGFTRATVHDEVASERMVACERMAIAPVRAPGYVKNLPQLLTIWKPRWTAYAHVGFRLWRAKSFEPDLGSVGRSSLRLRQ